MESPSNQAFDSDESEKCLQIESFVEHEFADYDLSKDVDACIGEIDKIVEQPNESFPLIGNVLEPYIGMEFKSRDDAREFYIAYGRRIGFTVRIHHNRRSRMNNMVIGQDFVCSKEGFREKKYVYRKDRVLPSPPLTREGCPAMLRLALRDGEKWVVTKFIQEHNHTLLSPSKVPWRGSGKSMISEDEKDQRIRELTLELSNERQRCKRRCAAYQEQLHMVLKYIEEHTDHMSRRVQDIVQNVRELEEEQQDSDF
ncbi:protein FAR1-RELATED SEQUENCE 8-like [Castanea sativa]|uniref:protein FAR1-RELATED SEQUENCE 8-like n=1 Tax=Castanea sativa TaxID=21020 RepID=UPI003AE7DB81